MAILVKSKDVVFREIKGESVMLNIRTGDYFGLNGVGTDFISLVDGERDQEEIIALLLAEYEVGEDVLRKDIGDLVDRMVEKGILAEG